MAIFTALALILPATFGAGATIFGLSAKFTAVIFQIGKVLLWSLAGQALHPKAERQQIQAVINQAAAPRVRAYGRVMLGGVRAFWEAKDGRLYQIVVSHHGPLSSVVGFEIDGTRVTVDGSGAVTTAPWVGYVTIKAILSGNGGNYPEIRAAFPTLWTTAHRLSGQATFMVIMKGPELSKISKVFPRQAQTTVQMIANSSPVFDPRTGMTAYSDNAGLCILDYLTHTDGMRIPMSLIDTGSFIQFADICDEDVPLRAGGTEKRYRIAGHYTLEDAPKDVLGRLQMACDARLFMTAEGKVGILGGAWSEPDVTLTANDLLSMSLVDGPDQFSDFNVLKGVYTSPLHRFQSTECAPWLDLVALETEGEMTETLEIEMCPSSSQMQRLMKIYRTAARREYTGSVSVNLVGLKARFPKGDGIHTVRIIEPESGVDSVFEVTSHGYSVAERMCNIGIASIENGYVWDAQTEEGDPPPALEDLERPDTAIAPPTGLTVSQQVVSITGGVNAVRLVLQVADPGREGLQVRAEHRLTAGVDWQPMAAGVGDLRALSPVVDDGQGYTLRARWEGEDTWSSEVTITALANPVAPAAPSALSRTIAAGVVTLNWVNPASAFHRTRIYRSASSTFASASLIDTVTGVAGQPASTQDTPGIGTWYFWAVTINASSVESTPAGPVSATI